MIGPVHEKETSASVKAIKKMLMKPEAESALASIFAVQEAGKTSSKRPEERDRKDDEEDEEGDVEDSVRSQIIQGIRAEDRRDNEPQ